MDVKPTRTGLLQTKKRLSLADKGHDLLKQKYDALMMKFIEQSKQIISLRKELTGSMDIISKKLFSLQAYYGIDRIEKEFSLCFQPVIYEVISEKVFGVTYPSIRIRQHDLSGVSFSGSIQGVCLELETKKESLFELINKQLALVMIAKELKRTKKKVNSLEKNVIPELEQAKKRIGLVLEEREKELFTTLKKVKDSRENASEKTT
ncbi:MAG: V-type ATP synthase subunit D [Nanoarchaeota archaeon]